MCRGIRSVISSIRPNWARADTLAKYTAREARGKRGAQTVLEYVALRARSGASACFESRFWQRVSNEAGRAQRRPPDTPARIAKPKWAPRTAPLLPDPNTYPIQQNQTKNPPKTGGPRLQANQNPPPQAGFTFKTGAEGGTRTRMISH
jgi:hypothetical protein